MNRKPSLRFPALIVFGIYALYSCLFVPLYQIIGSNVVYSATIWLDVVDFLVHLFETLGIAAVFGFLIHAVLHLGVKGARAYYTLFGGALAFKYAAAIVAAWIVGGSIDLTYDYSSYIVSILLEITECVFAVFIAHVLTLRAKDAANARRKAERVLGVNTTETASYFPFQKLLSCTNPLQRSAFWAMILVLVVRSLAYVMQEIAYSLVFGFSASYVPVTLLYWLILFILPCALGYLLSLWCIRLAEHERSKKTQETV